MWDKAVSAVPRSPVSAAPPVVTAPSTAPSTRGRTRTDLSATLRDPVLLGLAVLAAVVGWWFALGRGSVSARVLALWPVQLGLDVVLLVLLLKAASLSTAPRLTRRFWRFMVVGGTLVSVGDLVQVVQVAGHTDLRSATIGSADTLLATCGDLCVLLGMLTHPIQVRGRERMRLWLDAATTMTGATVFVWAFLISSAHLATTTGAIGELVSAASTLLLAASMIKLLFAGNTPITAAAAFAASAGLTLISLATTIAPSFTDPEHVRLSMASRLLPCILLAAAPRLQVLRLRAEPGVTRRPAWLAANRLPYLSVGATHLLLVISLASHGLGRREWGILIGVIVITGLVVVRQLAEIEDNNALLLQLRRQEERFRSLVQHASDVTMVTDADGLITYTSPAIQPTLGISPDEIQGREIGLLLDPDHLVTIRRLVADLAAGPHASSITGRHRVRHADGSWRWLEVVSTNLLDNLSVNGIVHNARDITAAQISEDRLRFEANHDHLTGLANRLLLRQCLVEVAAEMATGDIAVIVIDLDDFKPVNDTLGHHIGDAVLASVAARMSECVRPKRYCRPVGRGRVRGTAGTGHTQGSAADRPPDRRHPCRPDGDRRALARRAVQRRRGHRARFYRRGSAAGRGRRDVPREAVRQGLVRRRPPRRVRPASPGGEARMIHAEGDKRVSG